MFSICAADCAYAAKLLLSRLLLPFFPFASLSLEIDKRHVQRCVTESKAESLCRATPLNFWLADNTRTTDGRWCSVERAMTVQPQWERRFGASRHALRTGLTDYFIRCQTTIRVTFTPSRVVVKGDC